MFKIKLIENEKDYKGNLFEGFANSNGKDLVFSSVELALEWMIENAEFIAEFNHSIIVKA